MTLLEQVQAALNQAKYRQQNNTLHPEDHATLANMQADLESKIKELGQAQASIRDYLNSLRGHYS